MRVRSPPLKPLMVRVRSRSGRSTFASVSAMRCSSVQSASAMSSSRAIAAGEAFETREAVGDAEGFGERDRVVGPALGQFADAAGDVDGAGRRLALPRDQATAAWTCPSRCGRRGRRARGRW